MSKLIIDMPMPKNCWLCNLAYFSDDYNDERGAYMIAICKADKEERTVDENETERPSWCPIKGVLPEQHGRLIDEAVFCENVVKYSHQSTKTIGKALDATPTIIEMTPIVTERKDDEQIH